MKQVTNNYSVLLVMLLLFAGSGHAEDKSGEQIDWQVISAGATDGASANFGLQSTLGQPATGYGESENFGLSHGFWQESEGDGGTCCMGEIRGNVNNIGEIDIADLVYLVDYMFSGGPQPPCLEEADINGSGGIDISDLVYLVNYMFTGGPPPMACP